MKIKNLIYIGLIILGLVSCVDDKYNLDNLDSSIQLSTDLVGPLAYSRLGVLDVLDVESLDGLELTIQGDTMYVVKRDSQYLGNDIIDQLKITPSSTFDFQVPINLLDSDQPTEAGVDYYQPLVFSDINTNENERLDSILMGESDINVIIKFPNKVNESSYLNLEFNRDELCLNPEIYPENVVKIDLASIDEQNLNVEAKINLYGAVLKFSGKNTIHANFKGYVTTAEEMDFSTVFEVTLDCEHMKQHVTYVNIGNARDIAEKEKVIDFDYVQEFFNTGMVLPFYNPQITLTSHDNIGIPARYYIDYVEGISTTTGEIVRAKFEGGDTTSMVLNTPTYEEIKGLSRNELLNYDVNNLVKYSQLILDREHGHTDRLFKIKVDKLRYKYRIRSVETDRNKVHYIFHDSDIETREISKLPLWFEGDEENPEKNFKISKRDTVSLDMGSLSILEDSEVSEKSRGVLKFYYKNHLPLDVYAKVKFLDKYNNEIMLSSVKEFIIGAASIDNSGNVLVESEPKEELTLLLTSSDIEKLFSQPVRAIFDYKVENKEHKTIFLKSTDWLYLKVMFHFDATATIDFEGLEF